MIPWERLTRQTERYGHLWAAVMFLAAAAIVVAVIYGFAYAISLIVS